MEFYKGALACRIQFQETWLMALFQTVFRNNRRYGGYIVHFGIVFIFLGIAGSAYKEIYEFDMKPGQQLYLKEYTVHLLNFESKETPNQTELYAILDLYIGPRLVARLKPARFFYKQPEQPSTEVDIYSRLKEDVYFTLGSMDQKTQQAKIHITLNPVLL